MMQRVTKKDTTDRLEIKFGLGVRTKARVTEATKETQKLIIWRTVKKLLIGRRKLKKWCGKTINEVCDCFECKRPKGRMKGSCLQ